MSSERPDVENQPAGGREAEAPDDDFGDFEGFEGAGIEAQAAPSPWAAFPDLLPVQTSPVTPADEADSSQPRPTANVHNGEPWLRGGGGAVPRQQELHQGDSNANPQIISRRSNPPDVFLGTINRNPVEDVLAQGAASNNMSFDSRQLMNQLSMLELQLSESHAQRNSLGEQVMQLRQRNTLLEREIAESQAQLQELRQRLQDSQSLLEQRSSELRMSADQNWATAIQQLQELTSSIRETWVAERSQVNELRQCVQELKETMNKQEGTTDSSDMEKAFCKKMLEESAKLQETVTSAMENCSQQLCEKVSSSVLESLQKDRRSWNDPLDGTVEQIRKELHRYTMEQKQVLAEDRKTQLTTLSSVLNSALQQVSTALDSAKLEDGS